MIDIPAGPRPTSASPASLRQAAPQAPAASLAAPQEVAAPKVVAIERPDIKVDTEGDKKRLEQAITRINDMMRDGGRGLNFNIDPALEVPVVTVTNKETGEVIRQIPNEVVVRMAHSLDDAKGFLLNAQV